MAGSSGTAGPGAGNWDELLRCCDLLMVRNEIGALHRRLIPEASDWRGAYYFRPEYVAAWNAFRAAPNADAARLLLRIAPRLSQIFETVRAASADERIL